jgi:hypothetical protein
MRDKGHKKNQSSTGKLLNGLCMLQLPIQKARLCQAIQEFIKCRNTKTNTITAIEAIRY